MQHARALRPMGFLEIIDQTFRLYRANFGLLFMVAAVLYIPLAVLSAVPMLGPIIVLLSVPAGFVAYGAIVKAVSDCYLGTLVDLRGAYQYVWARFWPLVFTVILAQILLASIPMIGMFSALLLPVFLQAREMATIASGGNPSTDLAGVAVFVIVVSVVTVIAAMIAMVWFAFIPPVVLVEDVRYLDAIRRAWFLIRRWTWWRVFWICFVLALIIIVLILVLFGAAILLPGRATAGPPSASMTAVGSLILGLAEAILMPLFLVALIFVYYDSRIRKEGFDLQMLARQMGVMLPQAAAPAPPAAAARPAMPAPAAAAAPPTATAPAPPPARPAWQPSDPRLASRMPLSALRRIFVFTDSDGRATASSAAVIETVQDTAEAPLSEFGDRVPVHIFAQSNAWAEVTRTRAVPESVWETMSRIDSDLAARARNGQSRTCVRGFRDAQTGEQGVIIMVYDV